MLETPLPPSTGCHASGLRAALAMRLFGSALMGTWRGHLTVMSAGDLISVSSERSACVESLIKKQAYCRFCITNRAIALDSLCSTVFTPCLSTLYKCLQYACSAIKDVYHLKQLATFIRLLCV